MNSKQRVLLFEPYHNMPSDHDAPPLGLLYLASYLRRKGDIDVGIIHMASSNTQYEDLSQTIKKYQPDWIGISAITFESNGLHRIAAIAKSVKPDLPVVAGGPHVSAYTQKVMGDSNIDYAVIGEGELTTDDLAQALRSNGQVDHIDGLAWKEHDAIRINPRQRYVEDIDALPFPAWDLIDIPSYTKFGRMSRIGVKNYMGI